MSPPFRRGHRRLSGKQEGGALLNDIANILQTVFHNISLERICGALVLVAVSLVAVRLFSKVARRLLAQSKLDGRMQKLLLQGLKVLLYLLASIIVVGSLGIDMSSLVALLSVLSLGATLAAEDILANIAGGLVVLSAHPFAIGDYIEVSGAAGTVDEVTLNYTKLITPDGQLVMLPNKTMADSQMINYTALGRRRVTQTISASYGAPTEAVKAACMQAVAATEQILADPAPQVFLSAYQQSGIAYTVYCWTEPPNYLAVRNALTEHLRDAFTQAGLEIPFERLDVHIQQDG